MIALYLLWLIFNGRLSLDVLLVGVFLCAAMGFLLNKAMGYTPKLELIFIRNLSRIIRYLGILMIEMIKANIDVIKLILSPYKLPQSQLTFFTPKLKSEFARVLLANSITLTPGTITVQLKNGRYCVHGLRDEFVDGIEKSTLTSEVEKLEDSFKC